MDAASVVKALDSVDYYSLSSDGDRKRVLRAAEKLCRRIQPPIETVLRTGWVEVSWFDTISVPAD